jgi:hypothetical protein
MTIFLFPVKIRRSPKPVFQKKKKKKKKKKKMNYLARVCFAHKKDLDTLLFRATQNTHAKSIMRPLPQSSIKANLVSDVI